MSTVQTKSSVSVKAIIAWVVTILVPVILLLIPTNEAYTPSIRTFFAITICAILMFAFDQVHSAIPALLLPWPIPSPSWWTSAPPWRPGPSRWCGSFSAASSSPPSMTG